MLLWRRNNLIQLSNMQHAQHSTTTQKMAQRHWSTRPVLILCASFATHVLLQIWELSCAADGTPGVRHAASLEGHNATVNCVRFSKTGGPGSSDL
jgi:hypothetical protein